MADEAMNLLGTVVLAGAAISVLDHTRPRRRYYTKMKVAPKKRKTTKKRRYTYSSPFGFF